MLEIVTVRFEATKSMADFVASDVPLRIGDRCVVATERGVELGMVIRERRAEPGSLGDKIQKVLRLAGERDLYLQERKKEREESAYQLCRQLIRQHELEMKLSSVEALFDGSRVVFYFTADQRVDFRGLVKDLARELRTRIEMRQIGARDEARLVGGLGTCGTGQNCSSSFLTDLRSVTVKTVKIQELDMNPNRLSGMCGRLKCCLNFEVERPRKKSGRPRPDDRD